MSEATDDFQSRYPRSVELGRDTFELRMMTPDDQSDVLAFAETLPERDLLFLQRDIRQPAVMAAWVREIEAGHTPSLLALRDGQVVGCSAVVSDPHSFSPHVGEVRVILSPNTRAHGLGRLFVQESFLAALSLGLDKLTARMTADQDAAIQVFEDLGFRGEALLKNHVRDADGNVYDLVVLSHDVAAVQGRMALYGVTEALGDG